MTVNSEAVFEAERSRLTAIAGRILGSRRDADDVVQEAWLRLSRRDIDDIDSLPAWLTRVVTRLCLDHLCKSSTRTWIQSRMPAGSAAGDPAEDSVLADQVGSAMHVLMDSLAPAERLRSSFTTCSAIPSRILVLSWGDQELRPASWPAAPDTSSKTPRKRWTRRGVVGLIVEGPCLLLLGMLTTVTQMSRMMPAMPDAARFPTDWVAARSPNAEPCAVVAVVAVLAATPGDHYEQPSLSGGSASGLATVVGLMFGSVVMFGAGRGNRFGGGWWCRRRSGWCGRRVRRLRRGRGSRATLPPPWCRRGHVTGRAVFGGWCGRGR